jgi:hypothetical protein
MAALDQAAASFRPDREGGARFSSYAGTAVYRNMLRAVHNYGRVVPLPARMHQAMVQVRLFWAGAGQGSEGGGSGAGVGATGMGQGPETFRVGRGVGIPHGRVPGQSL